MSASSPIQAFSNEHPRYSCLKSNFPLLSTRVQLTSLTDSPITSSMQNLSLILRPRASKMVIMSKQSTLYKFYSTTDIMTLDILVW